MKKKLFIAGLFAVSQIFAQVTNQVEPKSWKIQNLNAVEAINLPSFDIAQKIAEDAERDLNSMTKPYKFGHKFDTHYSLENDGTWTTLANGNKIWQFKVHSSQALSINFMLSNFQLSPNAEMYVYNEDRSEKLGPFTAQLNNDEKQLTTWPLSGDTMILELYQPKNETSTLEISGIVHGYKAKNMKSPGDSGICNYDVDCEIGDPLNIQKKSIVEILINGMEWCSGTLLNNTAQDKKPYIMTADHCFGTATGAVANLAFRFNWKAEEPECPGNPVIEAPGKLQTSYGATVRAKNPDSDFFLAEINNPIPEDWDVVFAGWDRSGEVPEGNTYCLSHPSTDMMKIALNEDPLTIDGPLGSNFWLISEWEKGVTEGGSSGSGLFKENGSFIGNLYGGWAACSGFDNNGLYDTYGRFDISWTGGGANNNRVSNWLDPINTGEIEISYLPNIPDLYTSEITSVKSNEIQIYPNPITQNQFHIELKKGQSASYEIFDATGKLVKRGKTSQKQTVNTHGFAKGIYFIQIKDNLNHLTKEKLIIK